MIKVQNVYYDNDYHGYISRPMLINPRDISTITEAVNSYSCDRNAKTLIRLSNGDPISCKEDFNTIIKMVEEQSE